MWCACTHIRLFIQLKSGKNQLRLLGGETPWDEVGKKYMDFFYFPKAFLSLNLIIFHIIFVFFVLEFPLSFY